MRVGWGLTVDGWIRGVYETREEAEEVAEHYRAQGSIVTFHERVMS